MKKIARRQLVLTLATAIGIATGHAADGTWNGDANGTWNTATNWLSSTVADGATSSAFFGSTSGSDNTLEITANRTVALTSPQTIGNLFFGDTTANSPTKATWTVSGSTLNLGNGSTVGTSTFGVTSNLSSATISSLLAGTNSLVKTGAGTLILGGSNTYSGGTTVSAGAVTVNTSTALGSGMVTINSGQLSLNGTGINVANSIVLNQAGVAGAGIIHNRGNSATVSGNIQINNAAFAGGHFFGGTSGKELTLSGTITANSGITVTQRSGTVIYSGSGSAFDRLQTSADTLSVIKIGANNGLATNAVIDLSKGGTAQPSATQTLDLAGFNQSLKAVTSTSTGLNNNSLVTNTGASPSTLTLTGTVDSHFRGLIQDGTGTVALTIAGGNQTLSGVNTYTGGTKVTSGTLVISGGGSINSSALSVSSGAIFQQSNTGAVFSNALTVAEGSLFTGSTIGFTPTSLTISGDLVDGFTSLNFVSSLTKAGLLTVNLSNTAVGTYNLISSATTGLFSSVSISGTALSSDGNGNFSKSDGSFTYEFKNSGNSLVISTFSAVPEPSTYAALAGLGCLVAALMKRSRKSTEIAA